MRPVPTVPVVDRRVGERRAQARPPVRLLLVDDHPMFVASLHRVLEEEPDISVVADAGTLAEAERESAAQAPDVILLDQRLPDGLGIRHVPALHAVSPVSKIIILTATDEDRVLLAAIEAGCAGCVSKSSDLDELLGAVRAVAAGEVHMPPVLLRRLLPRLRRAGGGAPAALTPREPRCCASSPTR